MKWGSPIHDALQSGKNSVLQEQNTRVFTASCSAEISLPASAAALCRGRRCSRPWFCVSGRKPEVFLSCIPFLILVQGLSTKFVTVSSSVLIFCTGIHIMICNRTTKGRKEIRNKNQEEMFIELVALCRTSPFFSWFMANIFSSFSLCVKTSLLATISR